ncbi:ubiquitin-like-conjugating enzyme ATG10 isoform X4 [Corylus avellana]|uniref:ubiquitin-like-conjugating enzyme ATG10 isoform X4 n=1 Tax=Corylus avellana TaxID=13451 RepID=UPI00286AC461|nr:ubiquitin-like-conjugating enzyme ATG10 isoform X4 [Corylus avellana]
MDILSWDGTLSSGDFRLAACAFMQKWKSVMSAFPPWSWVPCPKQPWGASASHDVEGYLSLENIILSCYAQEEHDEISCPQKEETSCSEKEELIDIATLVQSNCSKVPYYDLHIIYSASYRVPVLFFRAYYSDGEPLGFNAIEKDLPAHSAKALLDSKWTFITQEICSVVMGRDESQTNRKHPLDENQMNKTKIRRTSRDENQTYENQH